MVDEEDSSDDLGNFNLAYFPSKNAGRYELARDDFLLLAAEVELSENGLEYLMTFMPKEKKQNLQSILKYMPNSKNAEDISTSLNLCRGSLSGLSEDELVYLQIEALKYDRVYSESSEEKPRLLQLLTRVIFDSLIDKKIKAAA